MSTTDSLHWLEEKMVPYYPIGDYKVHPAIAEIKL
jgi:2-oxoglutarate ferredoxin oxidoreductase subunit beta